MPIQELHLCTIFPDTYIFKVMSSFCKTFKKLNDGRWSQINFNQLELSSLNFNKVDWTLMKFICVYLFHYVPLCTTTLGLFLSAFLRADPPWG